MMCVNSIHLVNMVPVPSQGSAPAQKAGEESFVIKVTPFCLHLKGKILTLKDASTVARTRALLKS